MEMKYADFFVSIRFIRIVQCALPNHVQTGLCAQIFLLNEIGKIWMPLLFCQLNWSVAIPIQSFDEVMAFIVGKQSLYGLGGLPLDCVVQSIVSGIINLRP